nr:MAG TPA: hypothetical protein [Caudoviricetes sp.]
MVFSCFLQHVRAEGIDTFHGINSFFTAVGNPVKGSHDFRYIICLIWWFFSFFYG